MLNGVKDNSGVRMSQTQESPAYMYICIYNVYMNSLNTTAYDKREQTLIQRPNKPKSFRSAKGGLLVFMQELDVAISYPRDPGGS